ncbi:MAG: hypothetical protein ACOCUU_01350 [Nanoarchaeota archaeon]
MKFKKITLNYKNKKIQLKVQKLSKIEMFKGLMFEKKENSYIKLFEFPYNSKWKIHSCFVFFSFLAVWLDDKNNIIEIKTIKPWKLSITPKKKFKKLVEIPLNNKNFSVTKFLVEGRERFKK